MLSAAQPTGTRPEITVARSGRGAREGLVPTGAHVSPRGGRERRLDLGRQRRERDRARRDGRIARISRENREGPRLDGECPAEAGGGRPLIWDAPLGYRREGLNEEQVYPTEREARPKGQTNSHGRRSM